MLEHHIKQIASEKNINSWQVNNVIELLEGGATIHLFPDIAKKKQEV